MPRPARVGGGGKGVEAPHIDERRVGLSRRTAAARGCTGRRGVDERARASVDARQALGNAAPVSGPCSLAFES